MAKIEIVAYRSEWGAEFESIARALRAVVGDAVLRIDHIGSTAVPGLAAKDVIDIQITVADLDDGSETTQIRSAGYQLSPDVVNDLLTGVPDDAPELAKRFLREPTGARRTHIHVRQAGRLNQRYALLFRDYLRSDAVVREAYAAVKVELAANFGEDIASYYRIKDPYMDTIYQAARLWAQISDWRPDDAYL